VARLDVVDPILNIQASSGLHGAAIVFGLALLAPSGHERLIIPSIACRASRCLELAAPRSGDGPKTPRR
jgi:hypothetical protein